MKTFLLSKNYVKELALEKIDELKFKIQEIKQKLGMPPDAEIPNEDDEI